ncbi:hypothetical protein MCEMZLE22_01263 [actinobacterium SCGC AAA044-D11]
MLVLITGFFPSVTYASGVNFADCLSIYDIKYNRLGYDLNRAQYLSDSQKEGRTPAVAITVTWGQKKCGISMESIKINQFKFSLQIPGYREGLELVERETPMNLLSEFPTYEINFDVPQLSPGNYQPKLKIVDQKSTFENSVILNLNLFIEVPPLSVPATQSIAPTPEPKNKSSDFRYLKDNKTVWVVGIVQKLYTCWNSKPKSLDLQVKVKGTWLIKASAKISRDKILCTSKYPWVAKYSWVPDEFGEVAKKGSTARYLLVRELFEGRKAGPVISRLVYPSNSDRIQEGLDTINDLLDTSLR